jgi:2-(1,2-epoxy-1,2-dihydrophenyl)acetyl-CoA isomerase
MSDHQVLFEHKNAVAVITVNRPASLNALTAKMLDGLIAATDRCEQDREIRCVVIRGAGGHFMAGGDIKEFHKTLKDARDTYVRGREQQVVRANQLIYNLRRLAKPVIASVSGAAAGYGLSLMLAADLAIVADDAVFTMAYQHIGLSPDGGATYFLPRMIGERRAMELALLGERFNAAKALELGIVNRVVKAAEIEAETSKLARSLARGPTIALALTKRLIRSSLDNTWDEHLHREAEAFSMAAACGDHVEGVSAFVGKRKPTFTGE